MALFLVWMWVRHRDVYPRARNVVVMTTLFCFLIQIIPVAPPRMLPTASRTPPSATGSRSMRGRSGNANELAAMPSVHAAWSLIIALLRAARDHEQVALHRVVPLAVHVAGHRRDREPLVAGLLCRGRPDGHRRGDPRRLRDRERRRSRPSTSTSRSAYPPRSGGWGAFEGDAGGAQLSRAAVGGRGRHAGGEVEQHPGREALARSVEGGGPDAVVGRDPHDVDGRRRPRRAASRARATAVGAAPSKPEYAAACSPLSKTASIRRGSSVGVELDARRCRRRSARGQESTKSGCVGEVRAGVDVVVAGGDDVA